MAKGLNMQSVKNENRTRLLYLLNTQGDLSRKEIASRLLLTPAAVTKMCNELMDKRLIRESGEFYDNGKSGRREILLTLRLRERLGFGVNAEAEKITFSVFTLAGKLLKKERMPFTEDVDKVLRAAKDFYENCGFGAELFDGAGLCVIGSPEQGDFTVWRDSRLAQRFSETLGLPVVTENNVRAFVEAVPLYGLRRAEKAALIIKWGPGVGSALVDGGQVISDFNTATAELGHYIVNKSGKKCRCGRYGCLETEVSADAILSDIRYEVSLDEMLKNCNNNSRYMHIIETKIDLMAMAIANTSTVLNIPFIVLFGTAFDYDFVTEKLKRQCLRYQPTLTEDRIIKSTINDKRDYIGAAAICAKHFFFEMSK